MTTEINSLTADLGFGSFVVERLTRSYETAVNETAMLDGGFDRVITGGRQVIVLEGSFGVKRDGAFFRAMCAGLEGRELSSILINGVAYTGYCAVKAVVTESRDSLIGKYSITLKKL